MQPHDTSPSREYVLSMLKQNRTKRNVRNGKRRFLRIVRTVTVSFLWLLVKPNGIVLNDIGNVFLTCTCSSIRVHNPVQC